MGRNGQSPSGAGCLAYRAQHNPNLLGIGCVQQNSVPLSMIGKRAHLHWILEPFVLNKALVTVATRLSHLNPADIKKLF